MNEKDWPPPLPVVCIGCGHPEPTGLHIAGCAEAQRRMREPLDLPHSRWCPCPVCIWPKGHLNGCKWQRGPGDCTCRHVTADDLGPVTSPGLTTEGDDQ